MQAQAARSGQAPDADARYTRKNHQSYYGYKAHVCSDGAHQLIRTAVISAANANDAGLLERVVPTEAGSLSADKAYDTKANAAWLRQCEIENQIAKKCAPHIKLTAQDRQENQRKSKVRRGLERIFARWKQWQHYRRVRYVGLARNQWELTLKAVADNLKRLAGILALRRV